MPVIRLACLLSIFFGSIGLMAQAVNIPKPEKTGESESGKIKLRKKVAETAKEEKKNAEKETIKVQKPFFFNSYFRISAQDDFGYNAATLGWSPFYGRLMNETPWMMAQFGYHILRPEKISDPRATFILRLEGGSFRNTDKDSGSLAKFSFTQVYLETENIPVRHFVTVTGSLWYNMGYIGIYDNFTAQVFWETMGIRAGQRYDKLEYYIGAGDSGYNIYQSRKNNSDFKHLDYNTIPTLGALLKLNLYKFGFMKPVAGVLPYIQLGVSYQHMWERENSSLPGAPGQTPIILYSDVMRREVLKKFLAENPGQGDFFPFSQSQSANYFRGTFWLGFAGPQFGPVALRWNDLSIKIERKAPEIGYTETYNGESKDIYISEFTNERYELLIMDEMHWQLIPERLDMNIGLAFGSSWDNDNTVRPDDYNKVSMSAVIRPQFYFNNFLHYLLEVSLAKEISTIGLRYREHHDSVMSNNGLALDGYPAPDTQGLQWGDTDTKYTLQVKTGPVLNPTGRGIYARPSVRLLFGAQYSNVHAAFGNTLVESFDRRNNFRVNKDIHWHYMVRIEAEHWFSVEGTEEVPVEMNADKQNKTTDERGIDEKSEKINMSFLFWGGYAFAPGGYTSEISSALAGACATSPDCSYSYMTSGVAFGTEILGKPFSSGFLAIPDFGIGFSYHDSGNYELKSPGKNEKVAIDTVPITLLMRYTISGFFVTAGAGVALFPALAQTESAKYIVPVPSTSPLITAHAGYRYPIGFISLETGVKTYFIFADSSIMQVIPFFAFSINL